MLFPWWIDEIEKHQFLAFADFIPVLGYLDDVILLPMLVALTIKFIPTDIIERNRQKAAGLWESGKPKKWYYAIPIVLFWIIIIGLILKMVL